MLSFSQLLSSWNWAPILSDSLISKRSQKSGQYGLFPLKNNDSKYMLNETSHRPDAIPVQYFAVFGLNYKLFRTRTYIVITVLHAYTGSLTYLVVNKHIE